MNEYSHEKSRKESGSRMAVNNPTVDPASDATNLDIEALRKAEHDQHRESLDQLAPQLSRLSDTHEYLDDLASYIVSKTDFRNSENIRNAQNLISKTYASNEAGLPEFNRARQASSDNFLQAMNVGEEHESLDVQLDRSIALCGNLIITLSKLRAKRSEIKSYLKELTPLIESLQVIEDRLLLVSDLQQGTNTQGVTIAGLGEYAVQVNKDGQTCAEFNIEYRDIETFFYGPWSPQHNTVLSLLSDKFQERYNRFNYTEDELGESLREQYNRVSYKEDRIDELGESLRKNGWQQPVLLVDGKVFDGVARLLAAKKIGEKKIPVVDLSNHLMMWRLQAHETSLMVEELISKRTKQYLVASESELRFPANLGQDLSSAPHAKHKVEREQTYAELINNLTEQITKINEGSGFEEKSKEEQEEYRKLIFEEINKVLEDPEAFRIPEAPIPQSTVGFVKADSFVKADMTISLNGKPVTLYYRSEIVEMMKDELTREFRNPFLLPTIVSNVLSDGVSRSAKELAQVIFNRPKGFQWVDVVEVLRPSLTKILWRHWRNGLIKKINRGRYVKTDSILEFAKQVVEHGTDINLTDIDGNTPLSSAVQLNNVEAAALLIKNGADVNTLDKKSRTPLHRAAGYNSVDLARLLIDHNADMFAKDENGLTPKDWALREKSVEVSALLTEIN